MDENNDADIDDLINEPNASTEAKCSRLLLSPSRQENEKFKILDSDNESRLMGFSTEAYEKNKRRKFAFEREETFQESLDRNMNSIMDQIEEMAVAEQTKANVKKMLSLRV